VAGPFDEVVEEAVGVRRVREDLPAQEAVLGGDVALDVDEAQDAARVPVCQQQRGQATHGAPDQVEPLDPGQSQDRLGCVDEERDGDLRQVVARGVAASWRVVGEERTAGEPALVREVDVVLLARAEAVQEDDGGELAAPCDGRDREVDAADAQVHPSVGDFVRR
jgi:hypothetical protein